MPAVREMVERRTANTPHFLTADGSFLAEIHFRPIHFKAADGAWQPISGWANVFVGAEDQLMRVVTVDDTASVTATTEIRDGNNQPFPYRLRSQPAANNGRLYVLSGPVDIDSGQARLYCFE